MKLHIKSVILLAAAMLAGGCVDDDIQVEPGYDLPDDNEGSLLQLAVEDYDVSIQNGSRASEPSNVPEPVSEDEKRIQDFWMFQFNPDGSQLAAPKYYEIVAGEVGKETIKDLTNTAYNDLTRNTPMTIYIVTNTHNSTWATGTGFDTLEGVKAQKLPSPRPIRAGFEGEEIIIPMSGQLDNVTVTDKKLIVVPVIRMYAKVKILVSFAIEKMKIYDVDVFDIPYYCKVSSMVDALDEGGEPMAAAFPENTTMISRAFRSSDALKDGNDKGWIVIYIPENIRGEVADADKVTKTNIPNDALSVSIRTKYDGIDYQYVIYPGENSKNNFNVRRNCVYRVVADVVGTTDQHNPSSNCFVVEPGDKLQFEPYHRVETAGGFKIEDYLNPDETDKTIDKLEIIWQTQNCIGDNTNGDKVYLGPETKEKKYRKIIVHTQDEGNALVAARNSEGKIIWSWHIWVTDKQPDNLANALVYTTYRWDKGKERVWTEVEYKADSTWVEERKFFGVVIEPAHWEYTYKTKRVFTYTDNEVVRPLSEEPRIPGYAVMPCNLGALDFVPTALSENFPGLNSSGIYTSNPEDYKFKNEYRTFGMVYQWGRKDPFPPVIYFTRGNNDADSRVRPTPGFVNYSKEYTEHHYANDNQTEVEKTGYLHRDYFNTLKPDTLFYSVLSKELPEQGIIYGIRNPTVYVACTDIVRIDKFTENRKTISDLNNRGDWLPEGESNDELWGGLKPDLSQKHMEISLDADGEIIRMFDNFGSKKSVFDPCPTGWRVAPGELWLGFTETGDNPYNYGVTENSVPSESDVEGSLGYNFWNMPDVNWNRAASGKNGMMMYMQAWRKGPTSYFPMQGTRVGIGLWFNNGWCGNYHNATCSQGNRVNILHMHQNPLRMHVFENTNREYYIKSTASPVRCVRDRK